MTTRSDEALIYWFFHAYFEKEWKGAVARNLGKRKNPEQFAMGPTAKRAKTQGSQHQSRTMIDYYHRMRFRIEAARRDHSEAARSWEQAVKTCALEKVEKARMEMKKHRISLEESVAESVPGAGTGVKGMTWDMVDVIEPFGFDEPDAISIHCQGWPI
jgi:hypothetical protein